MSGGFFRGTSADQDTRFSNKQAKLMKSQKFPAELEHLVDMTKVKMDVMRPWIANRVTVLLGFEDEVLINFIYGLLDGKEINGKEVQISLTGFMEKNTGKFMKELWTLLLSAQNNASGVPQQLLDAKEEETRKKKAEMDRITNEIQKKREKEGRDIEQEKTRKMDGELDISRANNAGLELNLKHHQQRASSVRAIDDRETNGRNGSRGRSRMSRSPHSADRSPSVPRRSISKSSHSRSDSDGRPKSGSISPQHRGRSNSAERRHRSPPKRSITPPRRRSSRRSLSPSIRRSSRSRWRSTSRSRRRSPSPVRRRLRSPLKRGSRSPRRRGSRSPIRYRARSPFRRRSPSPLRRRSPSPLRRRSPPPLRRRSPYQMRRRSPSPIRRRSPSPIRRRYRRSPSPRRRSLSPVPRRSPIPIRRRSPTPQSRSPSPQECSSRSPIRSTSLSPVKRVSPKRQRRSPIQSPSDKIRIQEKISPVRRAPSGEDSEHPVESHRGLDGGTRRLPVSSRSPGRDRRYRNDTRKKAPELSPSPYKSPPLSESPPRSRRSSSEGRRSYSPYQSPVKQTREEKIRGSSPSFPQKVRDHKPRIHSPDISGEEEATLYAREHRDQKLKSSENRNTHSSVAAEPKDSLPKVPYKDEDSPGRLASRHSSETWSRPDSNLRNKDQEIEREKTSGRGLNNEVPHQQKLPTTYADEKGRSPPSNEVKYSNLHQKTETVSKSVRTAGQNHQSGSLDSGSEESDKLRAEVKEKRKHRRSERQEVASDDDDSDDSEIEQRKKSKRRRKEEKRFRKEERRRRREEKRRKKEERRVDKLKKKSIESDSTPSDFEKKHDGYTSDGERIGRKRSRASDTDERVSEQKKLEIELREKALESLRAKKGVGH